MQAHTAGPRHLLTGGAISFGILIILFPFRQACDHHRIVRPSLRMAYLPSPRRESILDVEPDLVANFSDRKANGLVHTLFRTNLKKIDDARTASTTGRRSMSFDFPDAARQCLSESRTQRTLDVPQGGVVCRPSRRRRYGNLRHQPVFCVPQRAGIRVAFLP